MCIIDRDNLTKFSQNTFGAILQMTTGFAKTGRCESWCQNFYITVGGTAAEKLIKRSENFKPIFDDFEISRDMVIRHHLVDIGLGSSLD